MSRIVEKLEAMERRLAKSRPFAFFALFQREGSEGWDLLVSAVWLNPHELKSWDKMAKLVTKSLSDDELIELIRVVILNVDDRFVGEVMHLLPKGTSLPADLVNFTFSGVRIQRGRIIAVPVAASSRRLPKIPTKQPVGQALQVTAGRARAEAAIR